jgi:hypothetical protein
MGSALKFRLCNGVPAHPLLCASLPSYMLMPPYDCMELSYAIVDPTGQKSNL